MSEDAESAVRAAFERGDFARVRELTRGETVPTPMARAASVDPVHAGVLVACAALVVAILVHYGL